MPAKHTAEAEKFWPGGRTNPVSLEGPDPLTTPTQPWWVIWKGGPLKSSMDPFFNLREPWGLKTTCHVTHFSLQAASFFYGDNDTTLSQPTFPKLWISSPAPRAMQLWTERGILAPPQLTACTSTPPLGHHEEGGRAIPLAMTTHQATIERQTPLLVWWSNQVILQCAYLRLILSSMK